jgi:hypothetical protein
VIRSFNGSVVETIAPRTELARNVIRVLWQNRYVLRIAKRDKDMTDVLSEKNDIASGAKHLTIGSKLSRKRTAKMDLRDCFF